MPAERGRAILAAGRRAAARYRRRRLVLRLSVLATAAAIALLLWSARASALNHPAPARPSIATLETGIAAFFSSPDFTLDLTGPHQAPLLAWLRERGAPADLSVPVPLAGLQSVGCRVLTLNGVTGYVICLYLEPPSAGDVETVIHLVAFPRDQVGAPPTAGESRRLGERGGWNFAHWAHGNLVFFALSQVDANRFAAVTAGIPG